jgi:glycosyltransferase involved in cell wall biosynthesis
MKVLHVVPSFYPAFNYGGPITSVYELCAGLVRQGCEVRVLTTDANGLSAVLDVAKDGPVTLPPGLSVRYCPRIFRHSVSPQLLWRLAPSIRWADLVHLTAVYNFPTFPTLAACRWLNKPLVWSPRGALQRWQSSRRPGLKAAWESVCRRLAPSGMVLHVTSAQEAAESVAKFPRAHAVVVPNGVELPPRRERRNGCARLRLLFLGRLDPKKGIENLLAACQRLSNRGQPWSLAIAGSGDAAYTASLQQNAHDLGLREQVSFVGEVRGQAKADLFAASDLAVFPSHTENFAMVVAEALAHGVPVVASKGTPWSGVEAHGCGLWVENDPAALAAAIARISRMPLAEMGERGRRWMEEEFAWETVAQEMLRLYGKLLLKEESAP